MKGDFTRRTFHSRSHYRQVLLQQGRVQVDADWNEQVDIQDHLDRTTTLDTVGTNGGPLHAAGMAITCANGDIAKGCAGSDLWISAGRYYVDGILCENDEPVPLGAQPDLPGVALPAGAGSYVAYLDVWSEHVTAVERPNLREVALGGPDTATRSRTIWQLRLDPVVAGATCVDVAPPWAPPGSQSTGQLRARAQAPQDAPNPCVIPATAGYRRLENQLYRVEIHDDSAADGGPTYVWSRDNGSVVARLVTVAGNTITIDAPGRDERLGFAKDDWVEVIDVDRVRRGEHGFLGRLNDAVGTELTVAEWRDQPPSGLGEVAVVRRWDSDGAVAVDPKAGWVDLEDGVQIQFKVGDFRTGDFWLIPARTANLQGGKVDPDLAGDVEWPRDAAGKAVFQPRVGIEHRFAAVALLDLTDGKWTLVSDCRRLFPPLVDQIDIDYAGGDGQEAMPGDPLPQPLEVSVSDGPTPVKGAKVRFTAADDDGRLADTASGLATSTVSSIEATTGSDGLARCYWRLAPDVARPSQRLAAHLVGGDGAPLGAPVDFAASLSIADRVWFDPGTCVALAGTTTVQGALDRLVAAQSLVAVGGDGQDGKPGADLPLPAEVLVRTDCGPVVGAKVHFGVDSGAVADAPGALGALTVDVTTGADGVARCFWRLGRQELVQVLTATLVADTAPTEQPDKLAFTANMQQARDDTPGLHVTDVVFVTSSQSLLNDSVVTPDEVAEGLCVVLSGPPVEAMISGKPVLTVTLDLPFPFSEQDQALWGKDVIGIQPLTLAGDAKLVTSGNQVAVIWSMTDGSRIFLLQRLFTNMDKFGRGDRVLCHLTLIGRAIADSAKPDRRVVNGLALGRPRDNGGTDLELPTVDDVRGADFTLWFWLKRTLNQLVVVPTGAGLFQRDAVREMVALAVPREQLRERLPDGVRIGDGPDPDLVVARQAADQAFHDHPERHLVIVADERYADAAAVIRDALGQIDVHLEVLSASDPAAVAQARTNAGEQLDGVLTDDASAPAITGLGGFTVPVPW